jgi:hypothetical protein
LLPWAAWRTYSKTNWRGPALAFALALACCVPWTIRNYEVFHRLIPLRSGFGFELYIGNNENYAQPQMVWPPKVSYERELLRYVRLGEVAFMDEEKAKALAFIKSHSRIALELLAKRIVDFWIGTLTPFHILLTDTSWLDRFVVLCNFLLPVGVVAGLLLLLSTRSPLTLPLAVFPALFPLVYYLTHTSLRYRHAIDPCAFLLAAVALVAIFRRGIKPIDSAGAALVSS